MTMRSIALPEKGALEVRKGYKTIGFSWDTIPDNILVDLVGLGMSTKLKNSYADIKDTDEGYLDASVEAAEDMLATLQAGIWSERGGRAANPVAKHARTIATLAAQAFFAGLSVTKDATKVKPGSPADRARSAIAKAKGVDPNKVDMKAAWTSFVQTKMKDPDVLAQARQRAEEDKQAESTDTMSVDELKALGLV